MKIIRNIILLSAVAVSCLAYGGYSNRGMFEVNSQNTYEHPDYVAISGSATENCGYVNDIGISHDGCYHIRYLLKGDIVLPAGISRIEDGAFSHFNGTGGDPIYGCGVKHAITSAFIPDSYLFLGRQLFYNCTELKAVRMPMSVAEIDTVNMFYGCRSLKSAALPSGTTSVEYGAFTGCSSLESVTIPVGVTLVGASAFARCTSLETIHLPDTITDINARAFSGCSALTEITLPNGLSKLTGNGYQFENCMSLKKINFGSGLKQLSQNMFDGCTALTEVALPDGVASGSTPFSNCPNIKSIRYTSADGIGSKLSGICPDAYKTITKVGLNPSSKKIFDSQFEGCAALQEVEIPEGVTSIGSKAFKDCVSLTSLVLPSTVNLQQSSYATPFLGCTSLKSIRFMGKCPFSDSYYYRYLFSGLPSDCVVYFQKGASGWVEGTYSGIKVVPYEESSRPAEIEQAPESVQTAFDAWVKAYAVTDPAKASVNAFILGLSPSATEADLKDAVTGELAKIDFDALIKGDLSAAVSQIQATYPNAAVTIELVELKNSSAVLYRLKFSLPTQN
ncbi:MAG: leucine-rich repeat domain-containing protein [Kiritimatiellae bacterium]|nr:leucine-rich repeat domain-containing protein [Kiritimatiellia bacterium]